MTDQGYNLTVMWECELTKQLSRDPEMKAFFAGVELHDPMDPRDCLYGGRTNTRKMYHKCVEGETISYTDVCSLYPWVCKYGTFPVDHPTVVTENFLPIEQQPYHGLIKCRVLPPRDLLHPVLPTRGDGKLLFHLCRTCAQTRDPNCEHDDADRMFWGSWPTCEVYKAIEKGYKVVEIAEVYHYDKWSSGNNGLFTGYINAFLKSKQEASGWPSWATTDDLKNDYIRDYKLREGIDLDPKNISLNPGLRQLSKLSLNSFWGYLAMRSTLTKKLYFTDSAEYFKIVLDPTNEIQDVRIISPVMLSVTYRKVDALCPELVNTSVVTAAWVTAQARLKLYSYLEKLQDRVMYMDTDSVFYLSGSPGEYQVPLGDYLGDMTDELNGAHITEFVSTGPKQYAYITNTGESCVKIRGFTLDSEVSKKLNFETLKKMVFYYMKNQKLTVDVVRSQIARLPNHIVVTKPLKKRYGMVFSKCYVASDYTCLPYGYVQ